MKNPQLFGILMQPAMCLATLDERKRVTRRMLNPQPVELAELGLPGTIRAALKHLKQYPRKGYREVYRKGILKHMVGPKCRYGQPGDVLYVKETWSVIGPDTGPDFVVPTDMPHLHHAESGFDQLVVHRAGKEKFDWNRYGGPPKWRSSMFMPATGARIFLEVKSIECQRLHDMTEEDAKLEGVEPFVPLATWRKNGKGNPDKYRWKNGKNSPIIDVTNQGAASGLWRNYNDARKPVNTALESFATLWDSINGAGSYETQNPFLWVIRFKTISRHDKKVIALLSDFITRGACSGHFVPY